MVFFLFYGPLSLSRGRRGGLLVLFIRLNATPKQAGGHYNSAPAESAAARSFRSSQTVRFNLLIQNSLMVQNSLRTDGKHVKTL